MATAADITIFRDHAPAYSLSFPRDQTERAGGKRSAEQLRCPSSLRMRPRSTDNPGNGVSSPLLYFWIETSVLRIWRKSPPMLDSRSENSPSLSSCSSVQGLYQSLQGPSGQDPDPQVQFWRHADKERRYA